MSSHEGRVDAPDEVARSTEALTAQEQWLLRFDDAGLVSEVHDYPATGGCPPLRAAAARSSTRGGNRGTAFDR